MLTRRELNRTLLLRQGLLERERMPALDMVEQLVGLQAQVPENPYIGLWTRLEGFAPAELSELIAERRAVRANLMRNTLHLVSAADCLALHPLTTPLRIRTFWSPFGAALRGADPDAVAEAARAFLAEAPRTRAELSDHLAARWPEAEPLPLAYLATHYLPLVQVPPRGLWGGRGLPAYALADEWLGAPLHAEADLAPFVLRYLAAFGPASASDVRTWAGVTGVRPVIERLRPGLCTFRDERGRELLDVPDGAFADPATPAPPRFLPEFDNVLLSHDDRTRVLGEHGPGLTYPRGSTIGSLLVDGFYRGTWRAEGHTVTVDRFTDRPGDPPDTRAAIEAEALRLLELLDPGVSAPRLRFAG